MNDENQDTNAPFHLSHHHLLEQNAANQNKKLEISPTRPNFSSPQTQTSSSVASSNHISSSSPYRHMMHSSQPHRFHGHMMQGHSHKYSRQHASHARSTAHDNLQRRVQKLEQDVLSKNIQHDIMVNKEEMMGKRLKTKDIRIKNLQNDINKLRDQLTSKNEAQDKLVNEMSELQQQNMGLSTKLRESNIGLNISDADDTHHYNESMRDILNHIQQKMYQLTTDIQEMKQNDEPQQSPDIVSTIQTCMAPMMQQMKEQQREFMTDLSSQMQKYEGGLDDKYKAFERENNMNVVLNKLNQMNQNRMDSVNNHKHLERYLEQNTKAIKESQKRAMNDLKEDIKREICSTKSELDTQIQTVKSDTHANIKQCTHDLKYEIKKQKDDKKQDVMHQVNTDAMSNECKELIQSQSGQIQQNTSTLEEIKQDNKRMSESMKQDIASCVRKMRQLSDENTTKISNMIVGLKPLFEKMQNHRQSSNDSVVERIDQNNSDLIQSFAQFKHDFQKIIESVLSQTPSVVSSPVHPQASDTRKMKDTSSVLNEMKRMSGYLNDMKSSERTGFSSMNKNIQQMTRRHDEMVKIMTNTLPTSMDKVKKDSAKLAQMCVDLKQTMEQMNKVQRTQQMTHKMSSVSPSKHVYNGNAQSHDESVKLMKSLIMSQIEEMKKSFSKMDSNMTSKFDRLLQEINSRNVSLFNNIKQINDKQQQHIVTQSDSNRKKAIKNHESILKNHLQQIQLRLSELNNTTQTVNKSSLSLIKESIDETMNEKMETVVNELRTMMSMKEVKDVMNYMRNDVMKEVQLIKNLCNDMHKKSQQLPHFVARNKDLKVIQQSLNELPILMRKKPVVSTTVNTIETGHVNGMAANKVMNVLMMPFKIWCENILSQISNHRDQCSIFVIIYVLSQIAFATFSYRLEEEHKHDEDGGNVECLSRIQTRALSILDDIEKAKEDEEMDKQVIIQTVIEWMQRILSDKMEDVWISRTGQEMAHLCHVQFKVNDALTMIKHKMNEMIKKQSKTCLNMAVFQPLVLCGCSMFVVCFCLWMQSLQSQQNLFF
eukprot:190312_1